MKALKVIFVFIMLSILSCNQEIEKPENLIPEDKMKAIVRDMYLYKNLEEVNFIKKKEKEPADITLAVLEKHRVSLEEFEVSYQYYTIQNAAYDEFLKDIKDELMESEYAPSRDTMNGKVKPELSKPKK